VEVDWSAWLRLIERRRRLLRRHHAPTAGRRAARLAGEHLAALTYASFRLDGLDLTEAEVSRALARAAATRSLPSRQSQRIRNHVAILRRVESALRLGQPLKTAAVVRWYTSVSCGLCLSSLDGAAISRLDHVIRRINSPQLRLQPAITDIAALHAELIAEPLVPSFNGILARLLLQYHLGRCHLPPVSLPPDTPPQSTCDRRLLLPLLLNGIETTYRLLLGEE
jgi:hypothetical protein